MKTVNELYEVYSNKNKKMNEIDEKIYRLQKKKEKLWEQSWIDMIVIPLAKALAKRKGLHYEIYGPFGLRCETTIYLLKKRERNIVKNDTWSITLTPHGFGGDFYLNYDSGERREEFPAGTIGMMNHFDHVEARLPNTIEEIEDLLIFAEGAKE